MTAGNPHVAVALRRVGPPPGSAPSAAILVHGRGQGPEFMLDVAQRVGMEHVHCALPAAAGNSWYPERFMVPVEANEPWLGYALAAVDDALAALAADGYGADRIALIGFSQGACLLAEYLLRAPRRYRAVALLTGGYLGPEGVARTPAGSLSATPVLLSSSRTDEWVPPGRVRETAALLSAMGATVSLRLHDAPEHGVSDAEARAVRELLA